MDSVGNGLQHGHVSYQGPLARNRTTPEPWVPSPSSTGFQSLEASAGPGLRPQDRPTFGDPSARPLQLMIEDDSPQQLRAGFTRIHRYSASPSDTQPLQPTVTGATTRGRERRRSEREAIPHPERRNTKRRRTGPERFDNYLHGDTRLPPNTTTTDVFKKYPNHITDEDIEECWRLGFSARQISELMPEDTQFNSDGIHVQQHHSLIQKKFKTFKERHEERLQALRARSDQPEGQDPTRPLNREVASVQEGQNIGSNSGRHAPPSFAGATLELPKLIFRYYYFDPMNDQAFEARISIELARIEPSVDYPAYEDHEIQVLGLLINQEVQRHGDSWKRRFVQMQPSTGGADTYPRSQAENHQYQQRLRAYIETQRASSYRETSMRLSQQMGIPWVHTTGTGNSSDALRLLYHMITQINFQNPINAAPPSPKRPLFNYDHTDLRRWRALARLLYYLVSITRNLEDRITASAASTQAASSVNLYQLSTPFEEVGTRSGNQTMAASDEEPRPRVGLSSVRHMPSTPFYQKSTNPGDRQYSSEAFHLSTSTESPSGRADNGYEGEKTSSAYVRAPYHFPVATATTGNPSDQDEFRSAYGGAAPDTTSAGPYSGPLLTSAWPPYTPRHNTLPSTAPHAAAYLSLGRAHMFHTTESVEVHNLARNVPSETSGSPSGLGQAPHRADSPREVAQDTLSTSEPPTALLPPTRSVQVKMPETASEVHSEAEDYVLFPGESYQRRL